MNKNQKQLISACMDLAFEAGAWAGQVDLEEYYDRDQYASAAIESLYARNTSMPMHPESQGNQVLVTLRSDEWRDGVRKTSKENLEKIKQILFENI